MVKRINVVESKFNNYLEEGLLKKEEFNYNIHNAFFNKSLESLKTANELFLRKISPLWVVVICYYSMFYMANAYIYRRGYKISHRIVHEVTNEALIVLTRKDLESSFLEAYELQKDSALNILRNYELERRKRSSFQYEISEEIKFSKAKTSLERAKYFVNIISNLIEKIK